MWSQRIIGLLGVGAVAALLALAAMDLGDPLEVTRGRLIRQAEAEARILVDDWDQALAGDLPIAAMTGEMLVLSAWEPPERLQAVEPISHGPQDTVGAALLQLARERQINGDDAAAWEALGKLQARVGPGPLAWEGRVQAVRLARQFQDTDKLRAALGALDEIPWSAGDHESLRLMGILAAAPALAPAERDAAAATVLDAVKEGSLAWRGRTDGLEITPQGIRVIEDPEIQALREFLRSRLPLAGDDWRVALGQDARVLHNLDSRLEVDFDELEPGLWHFAGGDAVPAGCRLALRLSAGHWSVALHTEQDLWFAAQARIEAGRGWSLVQGPVAAPREALGAPLAMRGLSALVRVAHDDPASLVRAERRRLDMLRLAFVVLALLIGMATWLGIRSLHRLTRLAELRSTFVASVSHDLRTPLASISNLAENLEDGVVIGEHAAQEYYGAIRREAARLGRLVSGLLDFAAIERGFGPRITVRPVLATDWARDLEHAAHEHCRVHGVGLRVEQGALPRHLVLDADAVHRAVLNLVENAVRHSGAVEIVLRIHRSDEWLDLQVVDQGKGTLAVVREDLFAPYVCQGEAAGTGLGLTIVRKIAEAHGGSARLTAGPAGRGLVASIRIASPMVDPDGDVA